MGPKSQITNQGIKLWRFVVLWGMLAFSVASFIYHLALPAIDSFSSERKTKKAWYAQKLINSEDYPRSREDVHKYFLSHDIYIPIDDILVNAKANKMGAGKVFPVQKHCGNGIIYVWIPLQLQVPFFGSWTFERCIALGAREQA